MSEQLKFHLYNFEPLLTPLGELGLASAMVRQAEFIRDRPLLAAQNAADLGFLWILYLKEQVELFNELTASETVFDADNLDNGYGSALALVAGGYWDKTLAGQDGAGQIASETADSFVVWLSIRGAFSDALDPDEKSTLNAQLLGLMLVAQKYGFDLAEATIKVVNGKNGDHLPKELLQLEEGDVDEGGQITDQGRLRYAAVIQTMRSLRKAFDPENGRLPERWRLKYSEKALHVVWGESEFREVDLPEVDVETLAKRFVD